MLLSSVYAPFSRHELECMLWNQGGEVIRLTQLLTTATEELHRLGADLPDSMKAVEDRERKWIPTYNIGVYNVMKARIEELEAQLKDNI